MASSTRQSRAELAESTGAMLATAELQVAKELLVASASLNSSLQLRSALSDPSAQSESKQQLIAAVFASKLSKVSTDVLTAIVQKRWSKPRDIAETAEFLAVRLVAALVAKGDAGEKLLGELYALQRILRNDADLELALSSSQATAESKQELLAKIFGGKVSPEAELLLLESVTSRAAKHSADVLASYANLIAEYSAESVAEVRVARPMSATQIAKLQTALSTKFGRKLSLNVVVDDSVVGGVRVAVGGQVLDATVQSKINHARLQLA